MLSGVSLGLSVPESWETYHCRQFSRGVRRGPTTEAPAQSASAEATCVPSDREVQRLILAWEYFFCSSALGR